MACSWMGVGWV